jgi:hypothetical protein
LLDDRVNPGHTIAEALKGKPYRSRTSLSQRLGRNCRRISQLIVKLAQLAHFAECQGLFHIGQVGTWLYPTIALMRSMMSRTRASSAS